VQTRYHGPSTRHHPCLPWLALPKDAAQTQAIGHLWKEKDRIVLLPGSIETVSRKVKAANLKNVRVVKGDALNTLLDAESMDMVLLFGVLPAPMLPLDQLLPEMHRILKPGGSMAVWPPSWVPQSIPRSGLFTYVSKRNGVFNFRRS